MPPARPEPAEFREAAPRWSLILRALRAASGVTQDGWAARLGYSRATVQRWERGQLVPDAAAEAALIGVCREKGILRAFESGPMAGLVITPEFIRDLLAAARGGAPRLMSTEHEAARVRGAAASHAPPPSLSVPTNISEPLTSFVGRRRELAAVWAALAATRLVTLTGPGGIGKTRLAQRAAIGIAETVPHGVWLVELAARSHPDAVALAVAETLAVREQPGQTPLASVLARVADSEMLLVLDNCEHLVAACAALVAALVKGAPGLRIIATSRQPLGVAEERVLRVEPLSVDADRPTPGPGGDEAGEGAPAVQLFRDRAVAILPTFTARGGSGTAVINICRALDGIPLAIELAAARVRILTPEQIAARLDDRFKLLTIGGPERRAGQGTLRATMDWSYGLLSAAEQATLRRLAVFVDGCEIESAEAVVASTDADVDATIDLISALADKSLVVVDLGETTARYRLLETVRAYALARLEESGEAHEWRGRHAGYFLTLAESSEAGLLGRTQAETMARLRSEHGNLRAVLAWARDTGDSIVLARMAIALWRFWFLAGQASEGRGWLETALRHTDALPAIATARLLDALGALAHGQGDADTARAAHERSLPLWRDLGDAAGIAGAVGALGLAYKSAGDLERAEASMEEALNLWIELGNDGRVAMLLNNLAAVALDAGDSRRSEGYQVRSLELKRSLGDRQGIAVSLHNLAEAARQRGEYDRAADLLEESLAHFRQIGAAPSVAQSLHSLALVNLGLGDLGRAVELLRESLTLFQAQDSRVGIALCLEALAEAAVQGRDHERAARLLGAADALREQAHTPLAPADRAAYDGTVAAILAALGRGAYASARAAGRVMPVTRAVHEALAMPPPDESP